MGSTTSFGSDTDLAPIPPKDRLLSLRTGKVRPLGGVKLQSAINKLPREGSVLLTSGGFHGDERDYPPHRSPDNAVHQYDPGHYEDWKKILPNRAQRFKIGAFGENIATSHLSESNVCVGDKFRIGDEAVVQISMSRQPCYKLNHRFDYKKMSSLTQGTGHTGWYYRVLKPGYVQEGDEMELIERINSKWSLSRVQHFLYKDANNMEAAAELVDLPGLSQEFIKLFEKRLSAGAENMNGRLQGDVAVPWRTYRVVEKNPLTSRVQRIVFSVAEDESIDADDLGLGRFPHLRLRFGPDEKFTRAYSVVSGDMRKFELGIARDDKSRGGSLYLHNSVRVGDTLQVAKGHSVRSTEKDQLQQEQVKKHVFIIGGIGVTAFLSTIKALAAAAAAGENMTAGIEIHYAVRSLQDAPYLDQLPPAHTSVYAKAEGKRLNITDIIPALPVSESDGKARHLDTMIYCCGPPSLLEACGQRARELGYPRSHVRLEEFGGSATGTGDPFEVEIKTTGKVLKVPQEKSLLQVLNEVGFDIDSSCNVGNCGTCMVRYCEGEVDHKGTALDEEQKTENMLSCVSRGKGKILVDC